MNKQKLIDLGISEEQANDVLELHNETLDGNYVTKSRFNEVNDEVKQLNEQLEQRDTQLEELRKVDVEKLQETITKLETENKEQKEKYERQRKQDRINSAVELALTQEKARNQKAAKALLDLENVELDEDGNVKGLDEQIEAIKESDAYLFDIEVEDDDETEPPSGAEPGSSKSKKPGGELDPKNMTFEQYQEWYESQNK